MGLLECVMFSILLQITLKVKFLRNKEHTAFSLHWWMTSYVFIQKMHYSLTSCQLYFLVPLSSFLAHLLALSHMNALTNTATLKQTDQLLTSYCLSFIRRGKWLDKYSMSGQVFFSISGLISRPWKMKDLYAGERSSPYSPASSRINTARTTVLSELKVFRCSNRGVNKYCSKHWKDNKSEGEINEASVMVTHTLINFLFTNVSYLVWSAGQTRPPKMLFHSANLFSRDIALLIFCRLLSVDFALDCKIE